MLAIILRQYIQIKIKKGYSFFVVYIVFDYLKKKEEGSKEEGSKEEGSKEEGSKGVRSAHATVVGAKGTSRVRTLKPEGRNTSDNIKKKRKDQKETLGFL